MLDAKKPLTNWTGAPDNISADYRVSMGLFNDIVNIEID